MSKVELQNITKIYDKTIKALDDISFTVNNGEFFVFIAYDRVLDDDEMLQLHNAFKDRYGL